MATNESPRRIVVWSDGCARTQHTLAWAAQHAAGRAVPLHIVQFSAALAPNGARGGPMHNAFTERDPAALDVVRVAHEMRHIHAEHDKLPVTFEVLHDASPHRIVGTCDDDDVLVTDSTSFVRLSGDESVAAVPVVIVPEHLEAADAGRGVLLVPGHRFSPPVAAFAFRAAADLGLSLDMVRTAPQSPAYGDDYWIDPGSPAQRGEPEWQRESARWQARFPAVDATSWVLRSQPSATLETMARTARLAVVGSAAHRELRALLDAGTCPIAVVPEP